jgi:1-acyl-sn-glycerol-3-phosphate acyltransferase
MVWLHTISFNLVFFTILVGFHPFLAFAGALSRDRFWRVFIWLNRALVWNLRWFGGTRIEIEGIENIPQDDKPLLIVANHQSMFDIPLLISTFWPRRTRFIAKQELAKGSPSVSIGLRLSQAALINRSDRRQAIREIRAFSQSIRETNGTACIFPEGTRGKTGVMKPFKPVGAATFLKEVPSAMVSPVAIHGSWFVVKNKLWPFESRQTIKITVLPPINAEGANPNDIVAACERAIAPLAADERATRIVDEAEAFA